MTETGIVYGVLLSSVFVLYGVFAWMPVTRGPRAFFGMRVEPAYFEGDGKRVLRRYRLVLAAVYLAVVALAVAAGTLAEGPIVPAAGELSLAAASFFLYMRFAASVRPYGSAGGTTRFASSLRVRGTVDRLWIDAVVAAFVALAFVAPALSYGEMPSRIPIHWNAAGQADGWVDRNVFAVLFIPVLSAYMQFFLYVLRRDLGGAKMTLPADCTEEYLRAKEKYLQTNVDTVDWARLTLAVTFCAISLLQTFSAVERFRAMEPVPRVTLILGLPAMLAGIAFFLVRMMRINARLQQQTGNDYAQRTVDETHWRHGGLTYSNPEDPALVVEKLVGIGYTLNMAHPAIRSRLLFIIGIPVFAIWAVLAM